MKKKYIRNPVLEVECDRVVEALEFLQNEAWVLETSIFGSYLHVSVEDEASARALVKTVLEGRGLAVRRVDRIMPSLEDVFIQRIEEEARLSGVAAS